MRPATSFALIELRKLRGPDVLISISSQLIRIGVKHLAVWWLVHVFGLKQRTWEKRRASRRSKVSQCCCEFSVPLTFKFLIGKKPMPQSGRQRMGRYAILIVFWGEQPPLTPFGWGAVFFLSRNQIRDCDRKFLDGFRGVCCIEVQLLEVRYFGRLAQW